MVVPKTIKLLNPKNRLVSYHCEEENQVGSSEPMELVKEDKPESEVE
jgi:hypothetical protein